MVNEFELNETLLGLCIVPTVIFISYVIGGTCVLLGEIAFALIQTEKK